MDGLRPNDGGQHGLLDRVKAVLTRPGETWEVIAGETQPISDIYRNYIIPLAAIPPIANFIREVIFGYSAFGVTYKPPFFTTLMSAVTSYILSLVSLFLIGWIIDALAPSFGATQNRLQAFKVGAYGMTAAWVAGILGLIPGLWGLAVIGGLYSIYLVYLGLPKLMKVPEDKTIPYMLVATLAAILLSWVAGKVVAAVTPSPLSGAIGAATGGTIGGTLSTPGGGSVDLGGIQSAIAKAGADAKSGKAAGVDPEILKGLLPAAIAGQSRSEISTASAGAAGVGGSEVDAKYGPISLKLVDMSALGAIAGIGAALGVQSSTENADGYEKIGKVDGRMTSEKWNKADSRGSFSVVIADRFMVEAEGSGTTMEALKSAVTSVDASQLESLAAK